MDRLDALEVLVAVVDEGSFSAGARKLRRPLPTVSRLVAMLEARLGVRLLNRTTRRLALTEAGQIYLERGRRLLADAEEAERAVGERYLTPRGALAVSGPILFGRHFLAPAIPDFLQRYPEVGVDFTVTDRFVDLIDEGIDVAIRVGRLADSSSVARKLGEFHRIVCGTSDYFERRGRPRTPADLARHQTLVFSSLRQADVWIFRHGDRDVAVPIEGSFRSNDADALLEAALAGVGLVLAPSWQVRPHLAAGRLLRVLADFETPATPIHALIVEGRSASAKIRAFVDYLAQRWRFTDFASLA
jgi:DNA-binding transcriptional LysR family regulator